jgi:hypothetical protein
MVPRGNASTTEASALCTFQESWKIATIQQGAHDQYATLPESVMLLIKGHLSGTRQSLPFGGFSFVPSNLLILNGGQRRDRTADAGLFRAALYH